MSFKFLEDVALADIAFEVKTNSLEELLEDSAKAVFTVMADLKTIKPKIKKTFTVFLHASKLNAYQKLLFDVLSEIVFLKDSEGMVFKEIKIKSRPAKCGAVFQVILKGDLVNPEKQMLGQDVKAITLHKFKVEQISSKKWKAFVILDI